jgi:TolB-like protein
MYDTFIQNGKRSFVMKKAFFGIFVLFAVSAGLFAQQPVVAVAPFDAISGISSTDANMITRVFFIRLGNTNKVSLVDRNVVDRVLREHSFQAGDWSNQQKTAELGTALNADWIVRGELEKFGTNILVTVQFYDIRTFRFMGGGDLRIANADDAYNKMDPLVDKLVDTISATPASTSPARPATPSGKTYQIGEFGPAGGIIFHDRGFVADGWRYLEAAPAGTDFTAPGQPQDNNAIAGRGTIVGTGKRNTQILVDNLNRRGVRDYAAQICVTIDINGFTDWFIPSREELILMYQNLHRKGLGGFSGVQYWSSSQGNTATDSQALNFSSGSWDTTATTNPRNTRVIRSF